MQNHGTIAIAQYERKIFVYKTLPIPPIDQDSHRLIENRFHFIDYQTLNT